MVIESGDTGHKHMCLDKFLKLVYPVSIYMYIETGWRITSVKFLLPFSLDSITILKFATILPDTSRPPNMCYCGKCFDNNLEMAAHNSEVHEDGYTCGYEGGTGPILPVALYPNSSSSEGPHVVHVYLENKVAWFPPFTVLVFELTP